MKLNFSDPKKSCSLPRGISPLVILGRNTCSALHPTRSSPGYIATGCDSSRSTSPHARSGGSASWGYSRRGLSPIGRGVLYVIAVIIVLCLPFAIAIGMTQFVQLVDRTQQWMFDNRIRDRLAQDLRSAVFRKVERDSDLNDTISVKYASAQDGLHKQLRSEQAQRRKRAPKKGAVEIRNGTWASAYGVGQVSVQPLGTKRDPMSREDGGATKGANATLANSVNKSGGEMTLARAVEEQLSATMSKKTRRWLTERGCHNSSVEVELQTGTARARLEWSDGCSSGPSCVWRQQLVDLHRVNITGANRKRLRVVLSEDAVVRLSIRCRARSTLHSVVSASELLSLIGAPL